MSDSSPRSEREITYARLLAARSDQILRRGTFRALSAAGAIHLLTFLAIWGRFRLMGVVALLMGGTCAFNLLLVRVVARRTENPHIDALRRVANIVYVVTIGHLTGWVLPNWLWLPFFAIADHGFDIRGSRLKLALVCAATGVAAMMTDAVSLLYPLTFAVTAFFSLVFSEARSALVMEMLEESDQQQAALQAAHEKLERANQKIQRDIESMQKIEIELRQAQKLEAVGRLASGIAHEINTPTQFVTDSVRFLADGVGDLLKVIEAQNELLKKAPASVAAELEKIHADADLAYLGEGMPKAIERALEGLGRVAEIVRSMKRFAHPDQDLKTPADLNDAIRNTVTIARNEYKYVADLDLDLSPIPPVMCHVGELNQVILNLLVNAAHAIADLVGQSEARGKITVRTRRDGEHVVISVGDTGTGIPEGIQERIFEPFFTTKEVGRGTGQGLAIARSVVDRHGGKLTFTTEMGKGSVFHVRLPIEPPDPTTSRGRHERLARALG
jgi:signal transduction histidine kinase